MFSKVIWSSCVLALVSKFGAKFKGNAGSSHFFFFFRLTTSNGSFCNDHSVVSEVSISSHLYELPGYEPDPVRGGLEDAEERIEHSMLISKEFYIWGLHWTSRDKQISPRACQTLEVYTADLTGLSCTPCADGLSSTSLSRGFVFRTGHGGRLYLPRTGEPSGAFDCLGPGLQSNGGHVLLTTFPHSCWGLELWLGETEEQKLNF